MTSDLFDLEPLQNFIPVSLMKFRLSILISSIIWLFFICCSANEKPREATQADKPANETVDQQDEKLEVMSPADITTYERDIKPILVTACTPCHLPGGVNPNNWDNYTATKYKIAIILDRVNRDTATVKFMPKGRPKLSAETIAILRKWVKDGTPEK